MNRLFVVSGDPGVGKSSWVRRHRRTGDVIWDMDLVCIALGFDRFPRPRMLADIVNSWREQVINFAVLEKRRAFIIVSNEKQAAELAKNIEAKHIKL